MEEDFPSDKYEEVSLKKKIKLTIDSGDEVPTSSEIPEEKVSIVLPPIKTIIVPAELKPHIPTKPRVLDKAALQKMLDHILRVSVYFVLSCGFVWYGIYFRVKLNKIVIILFFLYSLLRRRILSSFSPGLSQIRLRLATHLLFHTLWILVL